MKRPMTSRLAFASAIAAPLRKFMLSLVKLTAAAFVVISFGFSSHASAQVRFDGQVVVSGAYRPTGSDGRYERLYVIQGTNPNGAIMGVPCSNGYPFNDPAIFPGVDLANGAQDFTLLSTGFYGQTTFVSTLYFHVGTTQLILDVPETSITTTAPSVSGTVGATTITVSNFTFGPSSPYLDRVGFSCTFGDGGQDNVGRFTVTVTTVDTNVAPDALDISAPTSPVQTGSSVSASASFTDQNVNDSHTAEWNWGDGEVSAGSVSEAGGSGSVTGSHVYSTPGVYMVTLTVTDNGNLSDQSIFEYIVVYDPNGGFVTGGGWINSPAGAYAADPNLVGKANFGFNSKYNNGANVPTGNTEFQFKAGNLNFKSSSYEWLVVAGAKAQFKGTGTINGSGSYKFMLTAIDGQINGGGGADKFRIRIWNDNGGGVIYDNQMGADDNDAPTTTLGGGSIVIHKP